MHLVKSCCLLAIALMVLAMPMATRAQVAVGVSIRVAPPELPEYVQPECPAPGYIWTPGYWAYGDDDYYWVPGTWVRAPRVGVLWTPGYWGSEGGVFIWHAGYWGPHVGFYGGVNYGFGYTGVGFVGGFWRGGVYNYNRSVTHVNVTVIHNTYNRTVINNSRTINRVSYNGGAGGVNARPNAHELVAAREHHIAPMPIQTRHQQAASTNRELRASSNHGQPGVAATARPGVFHGPNVVPTRSVNAHPSSPGAPKAGNKPLVRTDRPPSALNNKTNPSSSSSAPAHGANANSHPATHDRPNTAQGNRNTPSSTSTHGSHNTNSSHANTTHAAPEHAAPAQEAPKNRH
jgi:WXXGXW repeat (2 copies)